ncbi:MAG: UDP-N-acetylglucosamine--N-acetylmuramyl-(pentapeptide) pyrophosphoryl-undecaprenol N-acetylglucosamine transferase [Sphaerochaeta sp.]|jgi:UDP-N-acetylglucosamine--N-acetylmuramyl-(pentapeptide) pyrophosphoryl-undecaprenol N-acetylglucosamine transferase|nr:UDP-N-acetylglucosamine--N-acetylmuramyl-(pentapeptide) pyrophosphoryl-undecaprenol N-acetylglucosamine transferase [Sphaerochaeta sp.]
MVVCYTGGGTLGHVYPALAVHEELEGEYGYSAFFIGRKDRTEQQAVEAAGLMFHAIPSGKLRRYRSKRNLIDPLFVFAGFLSSLWILITHRSDVLFSKGGFVTPPVVLAAWILRIPIVSHESDATPGLATRINSRFSRVLCTPFASGFEHLGVKKIVATGSPVRKRLLDYRRGSATVDFLGDGELLLLILGGSSGSQTINDLVYATLDEITAAAHVYHQCGRGNGKAVEHSRYTQVEFIDEQMAPLLERADLVVSRAGANTIAELALFGAPALLIPLSAAYSRGDQIDNARHLEQNGCARVLYGEIDRETFADVVRSLLEDGEARRALSDSIAGLGKPESASLIADQVREQGRKRSCSGE